MATRTPAVLFGALFFIGTLSGSTAALAAHGKGALHDGVLAKCRYLPLATNFAMPQRFGAKNTSVCVDIPVEVKKAKIVFNMDTDSVDGKGNSNGLKHMLMMGKVMQDEIKRGVIKPKDVSIIGIMHGSGLKWATKAGSGPQRRFIKAIFKLKREGVNLQLEACAAAMNGAGLTKKDLYTYDAEGRPDPKAGGRIYVNQGAFGRELYLQNHGYAYVEEGYDYHDKK